MKQLLVTILYATLTCQSFAQDAFLVLFTDKAGTPYSLDNPGAFLSTEAITRRENQNIAFSERDLPVPPHYVDALNDLGATVRYTSKWLNGALVECSEQTLSEIMEQPYIKGRWLKTGFTFIEESSFPTPPEETLTTDYDYGISFTQIHSLGIDQMHREGFTGEGITIAILDGGFKNMDTHPFFSETDIQDTHDFISHNAEVYDDHHHGLHVASQIGSFGVGELVTGAFDASFLLYRTEKVQFERKVEEMNVLFALERADSAGADIANISLGYNVYFDDEEENYEYEELDGNTALVTIAVDLAAATGMLVVTSAGNDGNNAWGGLSAPADADSALVVGSVNSQTIISASSSRGPTADGRLKPDVVAQGSANVVAASFGGVSSSSGTSFAAPLVTGLAAGLWQAYPHLTNMELIELIRSSGDRVSVPDNNYGYGLPNYNRAKSLLTSLDGTPTESLKIFPNPITSNEITIEFGENLEGKAYSLMVSDLSGKLIFEKQGKAERRTDLPLEGKLTNGNLYLFKFIIDGKVHVMKMMKA